MRVFFGILVAGGLSFLVEGCTTNGVPISALGTPQFVPQSQPDSVLETGIGQDPNTAGIFLEWYETTGAAGYKIYRADSTDVNGRPTDFLPIGNVAVSSSLNDTSMIDAIGVVTGVRYYYYLRAYAADGTASNTSDTINYKMIPRPALTYPGNGNPSVDKNGLSFSWHDNTGGGYTVVRVKDITTIPQTCIWVSRRFQIFESYPAKSFDFDGVATGELISGHSYQWRVDRFDLGADEGARSVWQTFTIK